MRNLPAEIPTSPLAAVWTLPLQMAGQWFECWLYLFSGHHLTPEERDDKAHGQLIVPEPLKAVVDHDLFA